MPYTNIAKPTGATYTRPNFPGKEEYDQSDLTYDSSITFYDSVNVNAFTLVAKPIGGLRILRGMATGLLIPLTYSVSLDASPWFKVAKPSS